MAAPPVAPREAAGPALARLVDTHAHLTDRRYAGDLEAAMERARATGIVAIVVVGYDLPSSEGAVSLAQRYDDVWAAVGVHPHNARLFDSATLLAVEQLSHQPKVVAIGECGLDFYRNLSPVDAQQRAFEEQLGLAHERGLPVIVHCRDAMPQTLDTLGRRALAYGGVMHCFDGTRADALRAVDVGLHISCAGPLTYRREPGLAEAVAAVPMDRLVVETDCPYLSPIGHRGERNEPAHVRLVAEALARIRGDVPEAIAEQTTRNAFHLFRLPVPVTARAVRQGHAA